MSAEDEDLTPEQVSTFRAELIQLKAELESLLALSSASSDVVELDQPIGRVSRIDAIGQQQMARASRSRNKLRLRQVEAALRRDPEEYGICLRCDEPIGYGRLSVRPEAPFCVTCQSQTEGAG